MLTTDILTLRFLGPLPGPQHELRAGRYGLTGRTITDGFPDSEDPAIVVAVRNGNTVRINSNHFLARWLTLKVKAAGFTVEPLPIAWKDTALPA